MSNSVSEKLALVKNLINEFKLEDALQLVKDIEQKNNLTSEEMLRNQAFKVRIHYYLGQYERALNFIEELYQKSQEMKLPLFSLDALFIKEWILRFQVRFENWHEIFKQHEELFNSIPRDESLEYQEREACLWMMKAHRGDINGNLDLALKYSGRSLSWFERVDPLSPYVITNLIMMASIYQQKGELNLALEYNEKALSLIPEGDY